MGYYLNEDGVGHFLLEDGSGEFLLEDGNPPIDAPFITDTTVVYSPTVDDNAIARISQEYVQVLLQRESKGRVSQEYVQVLAQTVIEDINVFLIA